MAAIIDYRGKSPQKTTFGIPLVTAKIIKSGRIEPAEEFIAEADYEKWMRRGMPEKGDVVMTTEAPLGEVAQLDGKKVALAQRVITLRGKPDVLDNTFLKFLLQWEPIQEQLRARSTGTTVLGIRQSELRKVALTLPPLAEQKAIAAVLGTLDDKIELNRRMNETLEALAQSLFKSWFVDGAEDTLPNGWKKGVVGDDFDITMGQSPPGETYNESGAGLPFFQGRADFGARFPALRVYCTAPTRIANPGDTLVCVRAPVGDINMAAQRCCVGRGLAAVRHKTGSRSYTYYAMRALREDFDRFEAEGTVFGSMNKKDFHAIAHVVPPEQKVKDFERLAHPLDERIQNNVEESRTLAGLRDTLLPKLFDGTLRLRESFLNL